MVLSTLKTLILNGATDRPVIDTTHFIQAQEYQIDLQDEQEAYALQSNISSLQESQINEVLNRVLNAHNNEPGKWTITLWEKHKSSG